MVDAKQALLAYALLRENRPGSLPCPDLNQNAVLDIGSETRGNHCGGYLGRLPSRTLRLLSDRNSNGERFWYALSRGWESNNQQVRLNGNLPGALKFNEKEDIVALIFEAPPHLRLAKAEQMSGRDTYTLDPIDGRPHNRVLALTRGELIRSVQRRVAGEVRTSLLEFRRQFGVFPGLSEVGSEAPSAYIANPGVERGRVGFTETLVKEEFDFPTGTVRFPSRAAWQLADDDFGALHRASGSIGEWVDGPSGTQVRIQTWGESPDVAGDLRIDPRGRELMLRRAYASLISSDVDELSGRCKWLHRDAMHCGFEPKQLEARYRVLGCRGEPNDATCRSYEVRRRIVIRLNYLGTGREAEHQPTRSVLLTNAEVRLARAGEPGSIAVTDFLAALDGRDSAQVISGLSVSMELKWRIGARPRSLLASGIYLEPRIYRVGRTDVARYGARRAGDLPHWFASQGWMAQTYVAFAARHDCLTSSRCKFDETWADQLRNAKPYGPLRSKLGVIVMAGMPFAWQMRAPSLPASRGEGDNASFVEDFLEGANVELLRTREKRNYESRPDDRAFNDQVFDIAAR